MIANLYDFEFPAVGIDFPAVGRVRGRFAKPTVGLAVVVALLVFDKAVVAVATRGFVDEFDVYRVVVIGIVSSGISDLAFGVHTPSVRVPDADGVAFVRHTRSVVGFRHRVRSVVQRLPL